MGHEISNSLGCIIVLCLNLVREGQGFLLLYGEPYLLRNVIQVRESSSGILLKLRKLSPCFEACSQGMSRHTVAKFIINTEEDNRY